VRRNYGVKMTGHLFKLLKVMLFLTTRRTNNFIFLPDTIPLVLINWCQITAPKREQSHKSLIIYC